MHIQFLTSFGISQTDIFYKFMDKEGNFKEELKKDLLGLLGLHEASFLGARDEEVLSKAMVLLKEVCN